jgi:hypothetical protein
VIPEYTVRGPDRGHKTEQKRTQTSYEVIEDGEDKGLGIERNIKKPVYREERRDGEDKNVQPVKLVDNVFPSEWGQGFLVFQRP